MRVGIRFQVKREAIAAAFARKDAEAQAEVEAAVKASGLRVHDTAASLCAVDTGYMRSRLGLAFSADAGNYSADIGWNAATFVDGVHPRTGEAPPFYPPFVEFGTARQAAQPSLLPALEAELPTLKAEIAAALARAMARG